MARFLLFVGLALSVILSAACSPAPAPTVTPRSETEQTQQNDSTLETQLVSNTTDSSVQSAPEQAQVPVEATAESTAAPDTSGDTTPEATSDPGAVDAAVTASPDSASTGSSAAPLMGEGVLTLISSEAGSDVALVSLDGTTITPVISGLERGSRAATCGDHAVSRDGRYLAFYAGGTETGTLYLMEGTQQPVTVGSAQYLSCVMSTVQFSDDASRLAYIDYQPGSSREAYAAGTLTIRETATLNPLITIDNTVAYDLTGTGVIAISLYRNGEGEADEAAVNVWDGSTEREIATLVPTQDTCRFMSAEIEQAPSSDDSGAIVLVMGQRCDGVSQMQWQFYTVNLDGTVNLVSSDTQPGDFVAFARNNNLYFSPAESTDGSVAYFTVPDGLTANTVALAAVNLSDLSIDVVVDRQAIFPTFSGASNAEPRLSANGRWLGLVLTTPNNENSLFALDLSDRANPPIVISAGARGDSISSLVFTPDNARIVYTAGGAAGADNSIFQLDLTNGTESRIRRGNFGRSLVMSHDGINVAADEVLSVTEGSRTFTYAATRIVNLITNTETTLFEDTTSEPAQRRSAVPIAWRFTP